MSKEYEGQDLKDIAARAEQDLNDPKHNTVKGGSLSSSLMYDYVPRRKTDISTAEESGIDQSVTNKFPGSTAGTNQSQIK